ncbi:MULTISPECIES: hypothetical protein [unclassified Microbacterium]|uniref:hypothetical protein n=1 Tax=unclassified Microbacterium TaxID=2609290 RepID=UPI003018714D
MTGAARRVIWRGADGMGTTFTITREGIVHRIVATESIPHGLGSAVGLRLSVADLRTLHAALSDYFGKARS